MNRVLEIGVIVAVFVLSLSMLSMVTQYRDEEFRQRNRPDTTRVGTNVLDMRKREEDQEAPVSRRADTQDRSRTRITEDSQEAPVSRQADTRNRSQAQTTDDSQKYQCTLEGSTLTCDGHEDKRVDLDTKLRLVGSQFSEGSGYADRCVNCKYDSTTGTLRCTCIPHAVTDFDDVPKESYCRTYPARCRTVERDITDDIRKALATPTKRRRSRR
jgi:hypothetical protein